MSDLLTERELQALADSFEQPLAQLVLERAGLTRARQPSWTPVSFSAVDFWRAVNRLIEQASLAGLRGRILDEAHAERPARDEFQPALRPDSPPTPFRAGRAAEPRISIDERANHRRILDKAAEQTGYRLTEAWTINELTAFWDYLCAHRKDPGVDAKTNMAARRRLEILIRALNARALLQELGATRLQHHLFVHIYWKAVNNVPAPGATLERLLITAAGVRDDTDWSVKNALARLVIGLASHYGISPPQTPALSEWLEDAGVSIADAEDYRQQMGRPSWLLIDLGDEPREHGTAAAPPFVVRGVLSTADGQARSWTKRSSHGLKDAMRLLMEEVQDEQNLVVDLALPASLMAARVEHWDVVRFGAGYQALSKRYDDIRLRWSRRLHHRYERRPLPAKWKSTWRMDPCAIAQDLLRDRDSLTRWLLDREHEAYPFLMGTAIEAPFDPLGTLLAHGSYFIIWLSPEADPMLPHTITQIARPMLAELRRVALPEQIPPRVRTTMAVIWDDPDGREGYAYSPVGLLPGAGTERK
ncbi:hypothetical protein CcI49_00815 [Frankia sp. CcI49]|nr:hypothetical protein CcI49_00815 [Frankia sp. CcI49]